MASSAPDAPSIPTQEPPPAPRPLPATAPTMPPTTQQAMQQNQQQRVQMLAGFLQGDLHRQHQLQRQIQQHAQQLHRQTQQQPITQTSFQLNRILNSPAPARDLFPPRPPSSTDSRLHFNGRHPPPPHLDLAHVMPTPTLEPTSSSLVHGIPSPTMASAPFNSRDLSSPGLQSQPFQKTADYFELVEAMRKASPAAVRRAVRDQWDKSILGSPYHVSFLANTTLRLARPCSLNSAFKDISGMMTTESRRHIVESLSPQELDEFADIIYAKASDHFLDKGMARRLETIKARTLVNALARAERLGYTFQDIVEERTADGTELVVPSIQPLTDSLQPARTAIVPPQSGSTTRLAVQPVVEKRVSDPLPTANLPASLGPFGTARCSSCGRLCSGLRPLSHHIARRACENSLKYERVGKDTCPHCGCTFTSYGGLNYHLKSKVCGEYEAGAEAVVLDDIRKKLSASRQAFAKTSTPALPQMMHPTAKRSSVSATPRSPREPVASTVEPGAVAGPLEDLYSSLSPQMRRRLEGEMRQTESTYLGLMQEAIKLPEKKREKDLAELRTKYDAMQDMILKKYGLEPCSGQERDAEGPPNLDQPPADGPAPTRKRSRTSSAGPAAADGPAATDLSKPAEPEGEDGAQLMVSGDPGPGRTPSKSPAAAKPSPAASLPPSTSQLQASELPQPRSTPAESAVVKREMSVSWGTANDPMQIDSSDSDDDEDIPAQLPSRQP